MAATYDLVITGGTVIDPSQGLSARRDVAIREGVIAAVEEHIPTTAGRESVSAEGKLVTPGLIDLHEHVYWRVTSLGLDPDDICPRTGVTTVVDAGSAGAGTFDGLRHFIIEGARTRVIPFLHVSSIGLASTYEARCLEFLDADAAVECVRRNRDLIGGIKVRANRSGVGPLGILPVALALDVAEATNLPLMVDMYYPPASLGQVFPLLRPGDISTHIYKGYKGGLLRDWNREVRPCALEARERGILFDLGHGAGSFAWEVAGPATAVGFYPDTISTDLHVTSVALPDCTMPDCMAKMMALGARLEEVVRWSTLNAARALRRDDLGTLRVGGPADVTVLELSEGDYTYYDVHAKPFPGKHHLRALYTLCRGLVTYDGLAP